MLMNFKNCAEDEECPIPDEVRESMLMFHNALLAHCGKTALTLLVYSKHSMISKLKALPKVFISKKKKKRKKWIILFVDALSVCWKR